MIECLVNEEDRSLQDASEVLGVLLTNLDAVNDALVAKHLPALFLYLDRKTMNPRRMYFFLRLSSFLFQNRTKEAFVFACSNEGFTGRLVKHLASPHILQLILLILNLERQTKTEDPTFDWSGNTDLVGSLVRVLEEDPQNTLDPVLKFLQEICSHNDPQSDFIKRIILAKDGALTTCLVKLTKEKSIAQEAIRLLDEFVLKVVMLNRNDEVFFTCVSKRLVDQRPVFEEMLNSPSLMHVLSGVKFINAIIKHKAFFLLGNGLKSCIDLMFRFPWSNILHNAILVVIGTALQDENEGFLENLLDAGLLKNLVQGLADPKPSGCKPHLRQLALTMQTTRSPKALERLATDPLWEKYWTIMEIRKNPDLTFVDAEKQIVIALQECLVELGGDAPVAAAVPVVVDPATAHVGDSSEAPKETYKPPEVVEDHGDVVKSESKVPQIVDEKPKEVEVKHHSEVPKEENVKVEDEKKPEKPKVEGEHETKVEETKPEQQHKEEPKVDVVKVEENKENKVEEGHKSDEKKVVEDAHVVKEETPKVEGVKVEEKPKEEVKAEGAASVEAKVDGGSVEAPKEAANNQVNPPAEGSKEPAHAPAEQKPVEAS